MKNRMQRDKKDVIFRIVSAVILTIAVAGILFPLYWLVLTSMKDTAAAYKVPPDLTVTIKDGYEFTIDTTDENDYDYETFKKDSVMMIWMLYDSKKTANIGDIKVNWVKGGVLRAQTEYSEINYRRSRNEVFAATKLTPLLISLPINYEACVEAMERKNAFKTDINKAYSAKSTDDKLENELQTFINELEISDRKGENTRKYFSIENIVKSTSSYRNFAGMFDNYVYAFSYFEKENVNFFRFMWNSLLIAVAAILFQWVFSSAAAYGIAKVVGQRIGNIITLFFIATMMIPSIVYIIPLYSMVSRYNLTDSWWAVVLPGVSNAVAFVLFRGFFSGIPKELHEAAKIDGANEGQIFLKIYIPMSSSVYGVIALLTFTGNWSDLMWPSMVLKTTPYQTFPVIINRMLNAVEGGGVDYSMALSMSVMAMIPTLLVFMLFQKQLSKGLVYDGIKG